MRAQVELLVVSEGGKIVVEDFGPLPLPDVVLESAQDALVLSLKRLLEGQDRGDPNVPVRGRGREHRYLLMQAQQELNRIWHPQELHVELLGKDRLRAGPGVNIPPSRRPRHKRRDNPALPPHLTLLPPLPPEPEVVAEAPPEALPEAVEEAVEEAVVASSPPVEEPEPVAPVEEPPPAPQRRAAEPQRPRYLTLLVGALRTVGLIFRR